MDTAKWEAADTTRLLPHTGAAGDCNISVSQQPYLEVDYTQEAVTIQCSFSTAGCPLEKPMSLWFRYGAHLPENLCLHGCRNERGKFIVHEALAQSQVSLTVNRVAFNDSALYICGIAFPSSKEPRAKRTGEGTMLVVRGQSAKVYSSTLHFAQPFQDISLLICRD